MTRPAHVFFILVPLYKRCFNVSPMMVERQKVHQMTDQYQQALPRVGKKKSAFVSPNAHRH
jgi:hypothetical protein